MTTHSPTPWRLTEKTEVAAVERLVANTGGYSNSLIPARLENEANARFIVQAANCHVELVAALKDLVQYLDNNGKESDVSELARAAIEEAQP